MSFLIAAGIAVAIIWASWRARRWFPVRVAGASMAPALRPGDLLAVRPVRRSEPRPGQIVVARRGDREIVKRVTPGPGELAPDAVWLVGDDPGASTDSRTDGPFHRSDVVGVVWARYWPLARLRVFR